MYRKAFGLTRHPFEKDIEPTKLFASQAAAELEARLNYLLQLRGIGLVTGEIGSGKTSICRKVATSLNTGLYKVFYVSLTTGNVCIKERGRTEPSCRFSKNDPTKISSIFT